MRKEDSSQAHSKWRSETRKSRESQNYSSDFWFNASLATREIKMKKEEEKKLEASSCSRFVACFVCASQEVNWSDSKNLF